MALEVNQVLRNDLVATCSAWRWAAELYGLSEPHVLGVNGQLKRLPWRRAAVLLRGMVVQGLRATVVTYNSMMNLVKWPSALQLLHTLQAKHEIKRLHAPLSASVRLTWRS